MVLDCFNQRVVQKRLENYFQYLWFTLFSAVWPLQKLNAKQYYPLVQSFEYRKNDMTVWIDFLYDLSSRNSTIFASFGHVLLKKSTNQRIPYFEPQNILKIFLYTVWNRKVGRTNWNSIIIVNGLHVDYHLPFFDSRYIHHLCHQNRYGWMPSTKFLLPAESEAELYS